ncbi:hypothetical protein FKW77_004217 [Venturia effusa]|uniref:SRR1-like domain-containing protein n=1 Tax=Venturia effusa TaxID=50376 RepID=A0A517L936_9PEZI|nr:hypothetical protein FKW77_004217 [Venturia effusa]
MTTTTRSEEFDSYYRAGKPLFTHAALLNIATQISNCEPVIHFDDFHGLSKPRRRNREPSWLTPKELAAYEWSIHIDYKSYEKLTCPDPFDDDQSDEEPHYNPIDISYIRFHREISTLNDLDQIRANFKTHGDTWLASQDCEDVVQTLLSRSTPRIRKIVAFALGSMARADGELIPRWTIQHALILGIADALRKEYAHEIRCFSQEPHYTDADKNFLREKGVAVLEDPMAFLEVDAETLVISIAPNVCVKQILADLTRPAVMMWDEVTVEDPTQNVWRTEIVDGVEEIVAPYRTDPNSPRVCEMVEGYHKIPFVGNEKHFGGIATYIRKDNSQSAFNKDDSAPEM